ncbi:glycosyltransferase family 2 protein [Marinimicrobium koreense]|uniref:glycosyltransferase family 2 protein n=1 Tax=Marinimicrobium koreense TaxID=306545 RepID=UPI0014736F25|nr:glycosyltransferase family 2 protein [Marinimicrobium koreense]
MVVIIPVYNGFDCVKRLANCEGLREVEHEVLFIDDASTDSEISTLLNEVCSSNHNFHMLSNNRNLGFVGTVNRGMSLCNDSDVILLNSDTVVPVGWVDSLVKIRKAESRVATISPLSNAAGFYSVPVPGENNAMPEGFTVEECSKALKNCSGFDYEESLTTCGFCQYITREAIDVVGYFDESIFHKGYGEETDFCLRAIDAGFKNYICLSEYVYHEREVSFGASKLSLKKQNSAFLKAMHPSFIDQLKAYEKGSRVSSVAERFNQFIKS